MKNVDAHLIYKVKTGSQAYGTNLSSSDNDYAGIFIQPLDCFFGLQSFDSLVDTSEDDQSYYSLRKYANLAVANNPNVLELIFTDPSNHLLVKKEMNPLLEHRDKFLSQRCSQTFVGYAKAQLHRIRSHSKWLEQELQDLKILMPLVMHEKASKDWVAWRFGQNMVTRVNNELSQKLEEKIRTGAKDTFIQCVIHNFNHGFTSSSEEENLELFKSSGIICPDRQDKRFYKPFTLDLPGGPKAVEFQEHLYKEAKKKRDQYVTWMAERNPKRHATEIQFGYDTKHAMHLVRLLRMGHEILTTGNLIVKRPDAKELLAIRAGEWKYEDVLKYADDMVQKINSIPSDKYAVPVQPNFSFINRLIIDITEEHLYA